MLEDTLDLAGVPESHKFGDFDLNSAIMRTYLLLANTLIHEFAHVFSGAYYNEPYWLFAGREDYKEPWVAGNRNNEMGYSLVKHVLDENPYASFIWRIPMSHYERNLQSTLCCSPRVDGMRVVARSQMSKCMFCQICQSI